MLHYLVFLAIVLPISGIFMGAFAWWVGDSE